MVILNLIVGIFMIGIGFLVKSFPELIAGYNTISKDKKKKVDIEGLSTYIRNGLITIGLTIIAGYFLFKWIGFVMIANSMILIVFLIGVTVLVINAQRFDHNKDKKTKLNYIVPGLVLAFVIGLKIYGFFPSKILFDNDSVRFSGMYGIEVDISDIANVNLVDNIPAIKIRNNGFSFGPVRKGLFNLDEFGNSRMLIHSENPPYLIISISTGEKIIINFNNKNVTKDIYDRFMTLIDK